MGVPRKQRRLGCGRLNTACLVGGNHSDSIDHFPTEVSSTISPSAPISRCGILRMKKPQQLFRNQVCPTHICPTSLTSCAHHPPLPDDPPPPPPDNIKLDNQVPNPASTSENGAHPPPSGPRGQHWRPSCCPGRSAGCSGWRWTPSSRCSTPSMRWILREAPPRRRGRKG